MKRYDNTHAISSLRAQPRNSNSDLRQNTTDQQKKRVTLTRGRRWYSTLLFALASFAMLLFGNSLSLAQSSQAGNLPIYTSPIDINGLKIQLRVAAPDRDTGKPVEVVLPVDLIGPKMNQLFSTPLSTQIDQYWSVNIDAKTGMTPRQMACDGKDGI